MKARTKNNENDNLGGSDIEAEREIFTAFLKERGLKLTRQRDAIFEEVFCHHGHIDADDLAAKLKKKDKRASRATVYRTLDLLVESGLVKPTRLSSDQYSYEHVHHGEHHDHLICRKCGKVIEFFSSEIEEAQIKVCKRNKFTPKSHTMVIHGLCEDCVESKDCK
ncbi:MAG: Fur family transcriptional regulator [bacterium]